MNYFVRKTASAEVLGPFSTEQIKSLLAEGSLGKDSLATADLGESLEQIAKAPMKDWNKLASIPDLFASTKKYDDENLQSMADVPMSSRQKLGYVTIAWAGTAVLTFPGIMYPPAFPAGFFSLVGIKVAGLLYNAWLIIGWFTYIGLTIGALVSQRRNLFFIIYVVLCTLLLLNSFGCRMEMSEFKDVH